MCTMHNGICNQQKQQHHCDNKGLIFQDIPKVRSTTATLYVTIEDVNDLAPVCQDPPVQVLLYPWTGINVATVQCTPDLDLRNGQLQYSINGGNDQSHFQVNINNFMFNVKSRACESRCLNAYEYLYFDLAI